jgi:hypothetical protein
MRFPLLSCLLLLAIPAQAAESWMVGSWFGYGQPNDKSQMWLGVAGGDGKFHVQHRACRQGKAFDATNDGTWSLKGDIFTVRIERVDGQALPAIRDDVYRVLSHRNTQQTYRYEATGFVYHSRKVNGKFQLPPCDLSS